MPEQSDFFGGAGRKMGDGHAGTPGTGPSGETCGTCKYLACHRPNKKRYYKCGIGNITHGPATDIRLKDPACEHYRGQKNAQ